MSLIQLTDITKIYGEASVKSYSIKNISLDINQSEMLSIMGPSGSGKSTLLNILGCMDIPTSGSYYLNDELMSTKSNLELSRIRNSTVSFVFQNFALMKDYSVYDNIELPLLYRKMSNKSKKEK